MQALGSVQFSMVNPGDWMVAVRSEIVCHCADGPQDYKLGVFPEGVDGSHVRYLFYRSLIVIIVIIFLF